MKDQMIIITEQHLAHTDFSSQAIRQTITAWLTKELHK